jgi:subtilase family serine protease
MGVTIVAASGDDGVGGFLVRSSQLICGYYAMYPASLPLVVAVGGTQVSVMSRLMSIGQTPLLTLSVWPAGSRVGQA